jgi:hypothetical protein
MEADDDLGIEVTELDRPEARRHVRVPERRVALEGRRGQVGHAVELPPLLGELLKRLSSAGEGRQIARALRAANLGLEGDRICLPVEGASAVA